MKNIWYNSKKKEVIIMEIYLDNAATTKMDNRVFEEILPYLKEKYGNPSSAYKIGRDNREIIENARKEVALNLNANPSEIYFTSGGSESDNMALKGIALSNIDKGKHIITSKIEHPAVLDTCKELEREGFEISYIGVDENGIVDLEELKDTIRKDTILISIMFANNEIGTIQPIDKIGQIAKKYNILFHTDSVQAIGNLKIDVQNMNIDSLSLSAHKFYGPKGIGVLYLRDGVKFRKYLNGGHQERNRRAGTENVAGIVGLAKALTIAYENLEENNNRTIELRNYFINEIKKNIEGVKINGDLIKRLPGNISISFEFVEADNILHELDEKGIYISTGSACTTGTIESSHVLKSIGLSDAVAHSTIRISIGKYNSQEDMDYTIKCLIDVVDKLRKLSPLYC